MLAPFFNSVVDEAGEPISIIAPALWSAWAPVIIAAVTLSIIFALVTAFRGWTLGLAIANVVVIGAGFALLGWWATHDLLLNPEFFEAIGWGAQAAGGITLGIMGLAAVNAVIEISGGFVKARRRAAAS